VSGLRQANNTLPERDASHHACGLESHEIECRACGVSLACIIDPYDEALLLGELAIPPTARRGK
jgi:hypothetical protein